MIKVNAIGDACPIPVVKTKDAIKKMNGTGTVEVFVDNQIAVQNLTKMANQKGFVVQSEKVADKEYKVTMFIGEKNDGENECVSVDEDSVSCIPNVVNREGIVVIDKDCMGHGNDELGKVLIKGFIYALNQQEKLPCKILFYNGGATLTTTGSPLLEDLKSLEAQGVQILTCGTCLKYYNLEDELQVGTVTNMYEIVEIMMDKNIIVKP